MTVLLDTNVIVRHLTGDPPAMAKRATDFLASATELVLADLVLAECVYVLESFYEVPRDRVAELMRAALSMPSILADTDLLLRALELYEIERLDFAEAYLAASAELSGIGAVASFDKALDRVPSIERIVP
ncbi:MAG TPA: PIN domain-containing protein [Solirubrobacterales bacterium]|nr:PIN domain-containing protein [Solirubrobacterales bacterium]